MTKLKQLNPHYPKGDCMRTTFACLLGYDNPALVPSFTEMEIDHPTMVKNFFKNIKAWLDANDLQYIELSYEAFTKSIMLPTGYCIVIGKSPRGDWNHAVIGEIVQDPETEAYSLYYRWDPSTLHDNAFLDGEPYYFGFLSRKI